MSKQDKFYETLRQTQTNTFSDGLNMDLHPLTTPNTILTDCVNGTMITYNDNEFVLQNDRGNSETNCILTSGYYPVAMKEYNGVLYIISHNPEQQKTEIGSYPSPTQDNNELEFNGQIIVPWINENGEDILCKNDVFIPKDLNSKETTYFNLDERQFVSMLDTYRLNEIDIPSIYNLMFFAKSKDGVVENIKLLQDNNKTYHFPNKYLADIGYKFQVPFIDSVKVCRTDSGNSSKYGDHLKLEFTIESEDSFLAELEKNNNNNVKMYLYARYYFSADNGNKILVSDIINRNYDETSFGDKDGWIKWEISHSVLYGNKTNYYIKPLEFSERESETVNSINWAPRLYFLDDENLYYDDENKTLTIKNTHYKKFNVDYYVAIEFTHKCNEESTKYLYFDDQQFHNTWSDDVANVMSRNDPFLEFYYFETSDGDLEIHVKLDIEEALEKELENNAAAGLKVSYEQEGSLVCLTKEDSRAKGAKCSYNFDKKGNSQVGIKTTFAINNNGTVLFSKWKPENIGHSEITESISECMGTTEARTLNMYDLEGGISILNQGDISPEICGLTTVVDKHADLCFTVKKEDWNSDDSGLDHVYVFTMNYNIEDPESAKAVNKLSYVFPNSILSEFDKNINVRFNEEYQVSNIYVPNLVAGASIQQERIVEGKSASFFVITTPKMLDWGKTNKSGRMDQLNPDVWFKSPEDFINCKFEDNKSELKTNIQKLIGGDDVFESNILAYLAYYDAMLFKDELDCNDLTGDQKINLNSDLSLVKIPYIGYYYETKVQFYVNNNLNGLYKHCDLTDINGNVDITNQNGSEKKRLEEGTEFSFNSQLVEWISCNLTKYTAPLEIKNRVYLLQDMHVPPIDNLKYNSELQYGLEYSNEKGFHFEYNEVEQNENNGSIKVHGGTRSKEDSYELYIPSNIDFLKTTNYKYSNVIENRKVSGHEYSAQINDMVITHSLMYAILYISRNSYKEWWKWSVDKMKLDGGFHNPFSFISDSTGEPRVFANCIVYDTDDNAIYDKSWIEFIWQWCPDNGLCWINALGKIPNFGLLGCDASNMTLKQIQNSFRSLALHAYTNSGNSNTYYGHIKWEDTIHEIKNSIDKITCNVDGITINFENITFKAEEYKIQSWNNFKNYKISYNWDSEHTTDYATITMPEDYSNTISKLLWYRDSINNSIDSQDSNEDDYKIKWDFKDNQYGWKIKANVNSWERTDEVMTGIDILDENGNNAWKITTLDERSNEKIKKQIYFDYKEDIEHYTTTLKNGELKSIYFKTQWPFNSNNNKYWADNWNIVTPRFFKWYTSKPWL